MHKLHITGISKGEAREKNRGNIERNTSCKLLKFIEKINSHIKELKGPRVNIRSSTNRTCFCSPANADIQRQEEKAW
jgi:hypothetical protein